MIIRRQAPETIPVATVTEATPFAVTIFAEESVVPSVGSVWGAFVQNNEKVAEDFVPGSAHTIYGVTFSVDNKWKAVTWGQNGDILGSRNLPFLGASSLATSAPQVRSSATGVSETTAGTSKAPSSASNTESAPAAGTGTNNPSKPGKHSKGHIGPIVGGAVGGVVAVAIIIFLVWFLLRKRKRKQAGAGVTQQTAPPRTDDDKYPAEGYAGVGTKEKYPMEHHTVLEPPQDGLKRTDIPAHELDSAKGSTVVMNANELGNGTGQGHPPAIKRVPVPVPELPSGGGNDNAVFRQELGGDQPRGELAAHEQHQHQDQASSPYVDAQRRMEIEWLEGEEARLRSRRELLRQQNGGE